MLDSIVAAFVVDMLDLVERGSFCPLDIVSGTLFYEVVDMWLYYQLRGKVEAEWTKYG